MRLEYRLAESPKNSYDWPHADEEDFRYRVALGDLILEIGPTNFSTNWGWIPLVDLAVCFRHIAKKLQHPGRTETFEFTESESWLRFSREEGEVLITSSYSTGTARAEYTRFVQAIERLNKQLRADLLQLNPELPKNAAFQKLLPE